MGPVTHNHPLWFFSRCSHMSKFPQTSICYSLSVVWIQQSCGPFFHITISSIPPPQGIWADVSDFRPYEVTGFSNHMFKQGHIQHPPVQRKSLQNNGHEFNGISIYIHLLYSSYLSLKTWSSPLHFPAVSPTKTRTRTQKFWLPTMWLSRRVISSSPPEE